MRMASRDAAGTWRAGSFQRSQRGTGQNHAVHQQRIRLALLLMALLLVTQFNSFYSAIGLVIGTHVYGWRAACLMITQDPFSAIMTGVGIVALAGIIVNNNIVLIDTFNEIRAKHADWTLAQVATHPAA